MQKPKEFSMQRDIEQTSSKTCFLFKTNQIPIQSLHIIKGDTPDARRQTNIAPLEPQYICKGLKFDLQPNISYLIFLFTEGKKGIHKKRFFNPRFTQTI